MTQQSKTTFHIRMSGINIFRPTGDARTGLVPVVRIWNTGTPSAVIEWQLKITINGEPSIDAVFARLGNVDVRGKSPLILRPKDDLVGKTDTNEIGTKPISGHLLFFIHALKEEIQQPSTVLELTAQDIFGVDTTVRQIIGGPWKP